MRLTAVFLALISCAGAQQLDIKTVILANGMTVIVHEDHRIPEEALYFFFKVGSRNEGPGTTGISHFFEHMMFNGAKKYGPGEFDRQMEQGADTITLTQRKTIRSTRISFRLMRWNS